MSGLKIIWRGMMMGALMWGITMSVAAQTAAEPLSPREQQRLADGLYAREMYGLALEEYEKIISRTPAPSNLDVLLYRAGECARKEGMEDRAEALYLKTVSVGKDGAAAMRARFRLADRSFREGELSQAQERIEALLALQPSAALDAPARFLAGRIQEARGETEAAATHYRELMRSHPEDAMAGYAALQLAQLQPDDPVLQRKAYEQALENPPSKDVEVEALWGLAGMATQAGDHDKAAELYWRLWSQHPDSARVRSGMLHIAWAQLKSGALEKALTLSGETSPSRKEGMEDTWLYLEAVSQLRLGRPEKAKTLFGQLVREFPKSRFHALAGYELAKLYADAGEHEKVLELAEPMLQLPEREIEGLWMLAESARATGKTGTAIQYYTRLSRRREPHPRVAEAAYLRALLLRELDPKRAAGSLKEFAASYPGDARAFEALREAGDLYMAEEEPGQALRAWLQALHRTAEPLELARLSFRAAMLEIRLERIDSAAQRLEDLTKVENAPPEMLAQARYWLGVLSDREGNRSEAEKWLRSSLATGQLPEELQTRARLRLGGLLQMGAQEAEALEVLSPLLEAKTRDLLGDAQLLWMLSRAREFDRVALVPDIAAAMSTETRDEITRELGFYAAADVLRQKGKPAEAVKAWSKGIAFESGSAEGAEAALERGRALLELGKPEEARDSFSLASRWASDLELGRLQAESMIGRGEAEVALGNPEAAAKLFMGVAVLFDDPEVTPRALSKAIAAYREAGRSDEASSAQNELQTRYPDALRGEGGDSTSISPTPAPETP